MLARLRSKLTYANVIASIALFVALGGVSWAAVTLPASCREARSVIWVKSLSTFKATVRSLLWSAAVPAAR